MKPRLAQTIAIEPKPIQWLLGLLVANSILCCIILAQLQVSLAIKLGLMVMLIALTIYYALRDILLRLPQSWKKVEVNHLGVLKLTNNKGQVYEPQLSASSFIHSTLTILNIEPNSTKSSLPPVILFTSAENRQELRKLRVWLRWWRHQGALSEPET